MKYRLSILSLVIVLCFTVPVAAQPSSHAMQADSSTGMMYRGMMPHHPGMMSGNSMMQSGTGPGMMNHCAMPCPGCSQGMMGTMMQGGMGMMNHMMPGMNGGMNMMEDHVLMKKQLILINRLPEMKIQLSLTDNQVEQFQKMRDVFQKKLIDLGAVLAKNGIDLRAAIAANVPASDVRTRLEEMAGIRIDMLTEAYDTAAKMKNALDNEQKSKLENQTRGRMMGNMMQ